MYRLLTLFLVIVLFVCCDGSKYNKNSYTQARVKRVEYINKDKVEETLPITGDSLSLPKKEPAVALQYHVIVASSLSENTAAAVANLYKNANYPVLLINANGRYRVSIGSFATMEEAKEIKDIYIKRLKKKDLWVFKH